MPQKQTANGQSNMLESFQPDAEVGIPLDAFAETPVPAPDKPALKRVGRKPKKLAEMGVPQKLLSRHCDNFEKMSGEKYAPNFGKDIKLASQLLKVYSFDKLCTLNDEFFKSTDDFVRSSTYDFGVFKSQVNKLLVQRARGRKSKSGYAASDTEVGHRRLVNDLPTERVWEIWTGTGWETRREAKTE